MSAPLKVAVIGNIGAGKTTIANSIATSIGVQANVIREPVADWISCGILDAYYTAQALPEQDSVRVLTQWTFQMLVLVSRLAEMRRAQQNRDVGVFIYDGHPMTDPAFTASYLIDPVANYRLWYEQIHRDTLVAEDCKPDLLVYVATSPAKCLEQIKLRDRAEETSVKIDYLQSLHVSFERIYEDHRGCKKIVVYGDGNMDERWATGFICRKIAECRAEHDLHIMSDEDSNL